jgi:hypothetical protein
MQLSFHMLAKFNIILAQVNGDVHLVFDAKTVLLYCDPPHDLLPSSAQQIRQNEFDIHTLSSC